MILIKKINNKRHVINKSTVKNKPQSYWSKFKDIIKEIKITRSIL